MSAVLNLVRTKPSRRVKGERSDARRYFAKFLTRLNLFGSFKLIRIRVTFNRNSFRSTGDRMQIGCSNDFELCDVLMNNF